MKKLSIAAVTIFCAVVLSGCGTTTPTQQSTPQTISTTQNVSTSSTETQSMPTSTAEDTSSKAESTNSEANTYKVGDTIKTENWEITVNSVKALTEVKSDYVAFKPDEGNKYIIADVSVKNIGKEADTFLPSFGLTSDIHAKLRYEDYEFSGTTLVGHSEDMHNSRINPLSTKSGIMAFSISSEIADKLDNLSLVFMEGTNSYPMSCG